MRNSALPASQLSSGSSLCDQEDRDGACNTALVGAEPIANVVLMEDHDGAYYAWKQAGVTGRILLHIDDHIDWNWIADRDPEDILHAQSLTQVEALLHEPGLWNFSKRKSDAFVHSFVHICNYIYPALREGIVREFYWIVPDVATSTPMKLRGLVRMFQHMQKVNPRRFKHIRLENNRILAEIDGRRLTTCSLTDLPDIEEPVLLDIDTDFLMRDSDEVCRSGEDPWKQLPWSWPDELVQRLRDKRVRTDFVTIAYSVEGGFTPLIYKYLGDELALRLKHPQLPERTRTFLECKRRAAHYRHHNQPDQAIAAFEEALEIAPEDASTHFNLAYLSDQQGAYEKAAVQYRQVVQLDPTYATTYNNFGFVYRSFGMLEKAQEEFQRMLRWDPLAADAHYGLGEILADQERWDDAFGHYRTVLALHPDQARAHRGLGRVYAKRGRWEEAIVELKRSVALQPDDALAQFWLAQAYARVQRWDEAIEAYRAAMRGGIHTVTTYLRLGGLYLRRRKLYKALKQYQKVLRLLGQLTRAFMERLVRNFVERLIGRFSRAHWRHPAVQERKDPLADH